MSTKIEQHFLGVENCINNEEIPEERKIKLARRREYYRPLNYTD